MREIVFFSAVLGHWVNEKNGTMSGLLSSYVMYQVFVYSLGFLCICVTASANIPCFECQDRDVLIVLKGSFL